MRQNDLYRAAHNIKPDAHMKGRLAVRVTPEPEPRVWVRTVGTVVATCMIAVMVIGGVWAWNIHGGEPGDASPNEGNLLVPGSSGTDAIPGGPDVSVEPSAEPADNIYATAGVGIIGEFIWPLESSYTIAKGFDEKKHPVYGTIEFHQGIDITAKEGEPIFAAAAGTIAEIGFNEEDGNYIYLEHGETRYESNGNTYNDGYTRTFYAQLSDFAEGLEEGSFVEQGDIIGYVGATGDATFPHLHFGLFAGHNPDTATNPISLDRFFPELDLRGEIDYEHRALYTPLPSETDGAFLGAYLGTGDDNGDETGRIVSIHSLHIDVYGYVDLRDIDPNNTIILTSVTHNGTELDITSIYDGWWRSQGSSHLSDPGSEPPVTHVNVAWHYTPFTEPGEYVFRGTYRNEPFECSATIE